MKALMKNFALLVCTAFVMAHCGKGQAAATAVAAFDSLPQSQPLSPLVSEISGIADSRKNTGYLWAQEDSGNPSQLYLVGHDGKVKKTIFIKGVANRDWEDMALVNDEIYIGDIGDNSGSYPKYFFIRFAEPSAATDTVQDVERIQFSYPDGAHDAEAFLVDSASRDIYVITKRDNPSAIYRIAYPYAGTNTASMVGKVPYNGVVSAAISPDQKEILVKTYLGIFYYKRQAGQTIPQALQGQYTSLPYQVEPQGEAVSFAADGSGFYTLSEKGFAASVKLYFYKRH